MRYQDVADHRNKPEGVAVNLLVKPRSYFAGGLVERSKGDRPLGQEEMLQYGRILSRMSKLFEGKQEG
jgi:hypothetical protein